MKVSKIRLLKRAAFMALAGLSAGSALAATATFAPTTSISGTANTGLPTQISFATVYKWGANNGSGGAQPADTLNWSGGIVGDGSFYNGNPYGGPGVQASDDALFNQSSGTFYIDPVNTTYSSGSYASGPSDPNSLTFTGGATYDFLRASTGTSGSSNYAGWYSGASPTYGTAPFNIAGADSFSSGAFVDANAATNIGTSGSYILLDSGFSGTVIMRTRPAAVPGLTPGTNVGNNAKIVSGTLEIHDAAAIPSSNQNRPQIELAGGTLAVNVDTGNYGFLTGSTSPSTTQLNGTLLVTASSNISNTAVDAYGAPRRESQLYTGPITFSNNSVLTVQAGGGTTITSSTLTGTGTIRMAPALAGLSASNASGANILRVPSSTTTTYDTGTNGIMSTNGAVGGSHNLGHLVFNSGTWLTGSSNTANAAAAANIASTLSIGATNQAETLGGVVTNHIASNTNGGYNTNGGASTASKPAAATATNALTSLSFTGTGTVSIPSQEYYNGATTISGSRAVTIGNSHSLGDGSQPVTISGATASLDLNGVSPVGKQYVLSGGSLVNNSGSATISNGISASWKSNRTTQITGTTTNNLDVGSGAWMASVNNGATTTVANSNANAGGVPTVTLSAPNLGGGVQATARPLLQLGWIRAGNTTLNQAPSGNYTFTEGAVGSGYVTPPKISFTGGGLVAGGRPIKVSATIGAPGGATQGQVTGFTVVDPGFGYTSIPTIVIDSTGTGGAGADGAGLAPLFAMTMSAIEVTNAGSGYTSVPTMTFGGSGYVQNLTSVSGSAANTAVAISPESAYGDGGFGNIALTAATTSSIGGTGSMLIDAIIQGSGNMNKVGAGVATLTAVNTFSGNFNINAGKVLVNGTNSGAGTTTVASGAILGGKGTVSGPVTVNVGGTVSPGNSIDVFTVGSVALNGSLFVEYDDSASPNQIDKLNVLGNLNISSGTSEVDFTNIGSALTGAAYVFASYGTLTGAAFSVVGGLPSGYSIDYNYQGLNQIALVMPVPEPSTLALMVVGFGAVALVRRRKMA